jgi:hypothetical protein
MKSVMKQLSAGVAFGLGLAAVAVLLTGCEWESSGSDGTWSDSMSWVNFSGLYRSGDGTAALVENFRMLPLEEEEEDTDRLLFYHTVVEQLGGEFPAFQTVVQGVIPFRELLTAPALAALGVDPALVRAMRIFPGSVTISVRGASTGAFADAGGSLAGTFFLVGPDEVKQGTGLINYDTGVWSLTLETPGFLTGPLEVFYSYQIEIATYASGISPIEPDPDPPTSHGWVLSLQVEQTGNRLHMLDNRGFAWQGNFSTVTTPSGDRMGRTSGTVAGVFQAQGMTDGRYRISGTFSGDYVATLVEGVRYGEMTNLRLDGIWMEPLGNGDLHGFAGARPRQEVAD